MTRATSTIDVLWCRPRTRRICRICGLTPVTPPRRMCAPCLAALADRPRGETRADLPSADLFRLLEPTRVERRLPDGRLESEVPSAELPPDPIVHGRVDPDELLDAIVAEPGIGRASLAELLDVGRDTIAKYAGELEADGRIRAELNGHGWRYYPSEAAP